MQYEKKRESEKDAMKMKESNERVKERQGDRKINNNIIFID